MRILVIEDEEAIAIMIKKLIENQTKNTITTINSLSGANSLLLTENFDIILADMSDDASICEYLQKNYPKIPFIILTKDIGDPKNNPILYGAQDFLLVGELNFQNLIQQILHSIDRHKVRSIFIPIN